MHADRLLCLEQMPDIRPRVVPASRASAALVHRATVPRVFLVEQVDFAVPGEQIPVPRVSAGHHAVEEIDPQMHRLQNVAGRSHPHQVARLVNRHVRLHGVDNPVHLLGLLANRQPADGVAVAIQFGNLLHVLNAQVLIRPALVDAEQHLVTVDGGIQRVQARHFRFATHQPAVGPRNAVRNVFVG